MRKSLMIGTFVAFAFLIITTRLMSATAPATQPAAAAPANEQQQMMQSWWEDLEKPDPEASRALLHFASMPMQSVAFMKDHLFPLKLSDEDLNKLLTDLGSDDESVWRPAFDQLEYFDPRLNKDLPTLMNDVADPPARTRLVSVLSDHPPEMYDGKKVSLRPSGDGEFNFVSGNSSWWAEAKVSRIGPIGKKKWTRAVRAIVLLESIGTPDAMQIIKSMSAGNEDAQPTKVAEKVLGLPVKEEEK